MKQYINIDKSSRLSSLINIVGERNIDYILAANNLARTPNIGQAFFNKCQEAIQDDSNIVNAIGFNLGELSTEYKIGDKIDVVGNLEINSFNGVDNIQINMKDVMKSI